MLSSPGWHWEEALIAPIVRSAFLIIVSYKEVPAPERAGVLDAGLWEPSGKERQGKARLRRWVAAASRAWDDLSVAQAGDRCWAESFCPIMEFTVFLT